MPDMDGHCTMHLFIRTCPFGQWMVKWTGLNPEYDHPNGMKHPIQKPGLYSANVDSRLTFLSRNALLDEDNLPFPQFGKAY